MNRWSPSPSLAPSDNVDAWPLVAFEGELWRVSPVPWAPLAIGDAEDLAASFGCEIPAKGLVDAIYEETNAVRIPAIVFSPNLGNNLSQFLAHAQKLVGLGVDPCDGRLYVGSHKDIIRGDDGRIGLYGWPRADGSMWQPPYFGHVPSWIDYSQSLRLVRKV